MDQTSETINWARCVYVDAEIDEQLVSRLTPKILSFRQSGNDPITVAIDSMGGSLGSMDTLLGLLTGPDQDGNQCQIITVVTNKAYSAAATLLAMGSYAVALPHADVLVHDVRYGGMRDVTPDRALVAAKQLQSSNERTAFRIANSMFGRWMWNYLDLNKSFESDSARYSVKAKSFEGAVAACQLPALKAFNFDLAGFATSVFARLTRENESLIVDAMGQLGRWGGVMSMARAVPKYSKDGVPGLLDGALALHRAFSEDKNALPFGDSSREEDLALFLTLILTRLAGSVASASATNYERALGDFMLLKSIEEPRHLTTATRLMLRHKHVFFDSDTAIGWDALDENTRKQITAAATPNVKVAWLLCVLVAREMLTGEHSLSPREALCLGLVDEVPGETEFESRRQLVKRMEEEREKRKTKLTRVRRLVRPRSLLR